MQVILLERIANLGVMGDTVTVKPGFARNCLLPKKKALRATKANVEYFKAQKSQLEATTVKRRSEAEKTAEHLHKLPGGLSVDILRPASETGHLYGAVRPMDIIRALANVGVEATRTQIHLDTPIKTLGHHKTRLILHPEVHVVLNVYVAQSAEEAALLHAAPPAAQDQEPQEPQENSD